MKMSQLIKQHYKALCIHYEIDEKIKINEVYLIES
jgi:hypothetical protein